MHSTMQTRLFAVGAAGLLAFTAVGAALADDTIFPDGDTAGASPNLAYQTVADNAHEACSTRGTAVSGTITVNYNGTGTSPDHHFTAGEALTVTLSPAAGSGITAVVDGTTPNVPDPWDANDLHFDIPIKTTVPASLASGTYSVEVTVTGFLSGYTAGSSAEGGGKPKYQVVIDCPVVVVPSPTVTTEVRNAANDSAGTSFALYTGVYDHASVSASVDIPTGSDVAFELWNGHGCGANGTEIGSSENSSSFGGASPQTANSSDSAHLHAGDYSYQASFQSGDTGLLLDAAASCEDFTVTQSTPDVATEIHKPDHTAVTEVPLGTNVHDKAVVTGIQESGFEPTGNVSFTFYGQNLAGASNTGGCTDSHTTGLGSIALDGNDPGTAEPSNTSGNLHAGSYAIEAGYPGNGDYTAATSPCEPLTVDKANTTTATTIRNPNGDPVTTIIPGIAIHDTSTVTSANTSFSITGNVTFHFYPNGACSGTPTDETVALGTGSTAKTLAAGTYSYKAEYLGNADYNASTGVCEVVTVLSLGLTRGSCNFDLDSGTAGQQFRAIYTPDPASSYYRLTASNPGEFFYNTAVSGAPNTSTSVSIHFPYPWVTKPDNGTGNTFHVYDAVSISFNGSYWCTAPSGNETSHSNSPVTLSSYSPQSLTSKKDLTVPVTFDSTGLAFIRVHVDFGLKSTTGWSNSSGTATSGTLSLVNNQTYTFTDTGFGAATTHSLNVFKKDPGIAGIVLNKITGDPIVGTTVKIATGTTLLSTLTTDSDGWYMYTFKYGGKTVTFTITLPSYNLSTSVTMKSNTFLIVNFSV